MIFGWYFANYDSVWLSDVMEAFTLWIGFHEKWLHVYTQGGHILKWVFVDLFFKNQLFLFLVLNSELNCCHTLPSERIDLTKCLFTILFIFDKHNFHVSSYKLLSNYFNLHYIKRNIVRLAHQFNMIISVIWFTGSKNKNSMNKFSSILMLICTYM